MSKRLSTSQSNTLFNYFQSPKAGKSGITPKKPNTETADSSDDEIIQPTKKRAMVLGSDSDRENVETPTKSKAKKAKFETPKRKKSKRVSSSDESSFEDENTTCVKDLKGFSFTKTDTPSTKKELEKPAVVAAQSEKKWLHETLTFLAPENIRDASKRKPTDPEYDERTVYVPESFLNGLTPAMRQWWVLKSSHYDTVLFFKVGKFYELYHMDASIGVKYLGFTFMKGAFAHSGFPETAYGKMASSLIQHGFKVARVEQTETPEMMAERCKASRGKVTKFDKVVNREICQISSKGACIYGAQLQNPSQALECYMISICEKIKNNKKYIGVCFIDTSIGTFHLSEFEDDEHCSRLLTLLAQHPPGLVLLEKGRLSPPTSRILKIYLSNVRTEMLSSDKQFLKASTVVQKLSTECYFKDDQDEVHWPSIFKEILSDGWCPKPEYELALKAFGACMWYLKDSLLDIQLISMKKFELYHPVDTVNHNYLKQDYMVLDSITLNNLNILGGHGTLQKTLDHCSSQFGRRLLMQWICRPLCNVGKIMERQIAVKELLENPDVLKSARDLIKKLPDLERQVSKINFFGNKMCSKLHPDSRAVLYEAKTYSKRKILDLLNTLEAFDRCSALPGIFARMDSRLLTKLTQYPPKGMFTDVSDEISYFMSEFDQKRAREEGAILPIRGRYPEYDNSQDKIKLINDELNEYLDEMRRHFRCEVNYFGNDKKRFQLEIPEHKCDKVDVDFILENTKKGSKPCRRYTTSRSRELLAKMMKAESERAAVVFDLNRKVFEKFSEKYQLWNQVIQCLMILDCLCSLAEFARVYSEDLVMPELEPFSDEPICHIENGRHPCLKNVSNLVPNDSKFGTNDKPPILILTGPNMGGKSTFMRQVLLISIMAQIGSFVPATYCKLSLIDRIFTRLGAYDDIMKHKSTFLVELLESLTIIKHATKHSFLLLDEFGRGTSTHDGTAVATAYVRKLCQINCRTMFSTHYHSLVEYFSSFKEIQFGYMDCMVENEGDVLNEHVIFLYKMTEGVCSNSYGFNVAFLAGMPMDIITRAREIANYLKSINVNHRLITKVLKGDLGEARKALQSLK